MGPTAAAGGCSVTQQYTVTIACPTLTWGTLGNATAGVNYNQTVTITPAGTYTFGLLTGNLPPGLLLESGDAPLILFAKGRLELLQRPALAMVGSRNCSQGGTDTAEAFAEAFSASGVTVVSGLAQGIDAAAHAGALRAVSKSSAAEMVVLHFHNQPGA